jgi:hypothetical protein
MGSGLARVFFIYFIKGVGQLVHLGKYLIYRDLFLLASLKVVVVVCTGKGTYYVMLGEKSCMNEVLIDAATTNGRSTGRCSNRVQNKSTVGLSSRTSPRTLLWFWQSIHPGTEQR